MGTPMVQKHLLRDPALKIAVWLHWTAPNPVGEGAVLAIDYAL